MNVRSPAVHCNSTHTAVARWPGEEFSRPRPHRPRTEACKDRELLDLSQTQSYSCRVTTLYFTATYYYGLYTPRRLKSRA